MGARSECRKSSCFSVWVLGFIETSIARRVKVSQAELRSTFRAWRVGLSFLYGQVSSTSDGSVKVGLRAQTSLVQGVHIAQC